MAPHDPAGDDTRTRLRVLCRELDQPPGVVARALIGLLEKGVVTAAHPGGKAGAIAALRRAAEDLGAKRA